MTMPYYSVLTGSLGLALAVLIMVLIRRDRLHVSHCIWWMAVALVVVLLGVFPRLSDYVAAWFNIAYPPSIVFVVAILALLVKALIEDLEISRDRRRLLRLAQKVSIMEARIEELNEERRNKQ